MPIIKISGKLFDFSAQDNGAITRKEHIEPVEPITAPESARPAFMVYLDAKSKPSLAYISNMSAAEIFDLINSDEAVDSGTAEIKENGK